MFNLINKILKSIILINLKIYKIFISPMFGTNCRYHPSCSEYFYNAIDKKGIFFGTYLGLIRLIKCNPWGGSGFDSVEKNKKSNLT